MQRKVKVNDLEIIYTYVIKNVKNINLHIQNDGSVVVTCNQYVPLETVDQVVKEKYQWILDHIQKIEQRAKTLQRNDVMYFKGKQYLIKVVISKTCGVKLSEDNCMIYCHSFDEANQVLLKFYQAECKKCFTYFMEDIYHRMSKDYAINKPTLKIRHMKSRWGSCIPSKNQITLNSRLIHYNEEFIEYVVLHEYAHLIQPNHSKAFYHVIEKYMPDYKRISKNGQKIFTIEDN